MLVTHVQNASNKLYNISTDVYDFILVNTFTHKKRKRRDALPLVCCLLAISVYNMSIPFPEIKLEGMETLKT